MLNAKRKMRWERAWVAVGLLCAVVAWPRCSFAQSEGSGTPNPAPPAALPAPPASQPAVPVYTPGQNQDAAQSQDAPPPADSASPSTDQGGTLPVAKNLQTGLPLRTVMSPLHWGHLSLLSFQGIEMYDSNYQPQQAIAGRQVTALQGLFVYSIQKARSSLDLQYCPYVWFSQNQTYKNFTANALDLATSHIINRHWSLAASDNFMYSPNLANTLQTGFSADYISNSSTQTAFLSAGRKALYNNFDLGINAQVSESSRLSLNLIDDYVRLGAYDGSLSNTQSLPLLAETMNAYGGGANLTHQLNARTSVNVAYNYRRQNIFGAQFGDSVYNNVGVGFSRILKPGLTFALEAGPAWNQTAPMNSGTVQTRMTGSGSAELFKAFHNGGLALSYYRNSDFSGVISNSFNNRYNVAFNRQLFRRWQFLASGSYIQQQYVGHPLSTGETAYGQLGYMLTRNWSVFTGYRYLNLSGNQLWSGPQQMVAAGIRWAWQPQNEHR